MKVLFTERAKLALICETIEMDPLETGGLLLGAIEKDTWHVIEVVDPGPNSTFEIAYFEYDKDYTQHLINKLARIYDHSLELIGLWHRHPGNYDTFSQVDRETNLRFANQRVKGAISGIVNVDPQFRITMYHIQPNGKTERIECNLSESDNLSNYDKLRNFADITERYNHAIQCLDNHVSGGILNYSKSWKVHA